MDGIPTQLGHVALRVRDLNRSVSFYRDVVGLKLRSQMGDRVAFLGIREWHFRAPVYIGDAIRVRSRVLEKELQGRGRRGVVVSQVQIVNQDGTVVQEGVTITLVEGRRSRGTPGKKATEISPEPTV